MCLTIEAMSAYNEAYATPNIILGCKKYIDKVVVIDDGSSDSIRGPPRKQQKFWSSPQKML